MYLVRRRRRRHFSSSYVDYIRSLLPYVYYPLNETSGVVANNLGTLGAPANGTATGITWAQMAAPGGGMAPLFDGVNDYVDVGNSTFINAFNGNSLTYVCWFKAYNIGVLTDGLQKVLTIVFANMSNYFSFQKQTLANTFLIYFIAGGSAVTKNVTITDTNWHCICATISSNVLKVYLDGYQLGDGLGYGTWTGIPIEKGCFIGSSWTGYSPTLVWHGYISHVSFFDRAITAGDVLAIYRGGWGS